MFQGLDLAKDTNDTQVIFDRLEAGVEIDELLASIEGPYVCDCTFRKRAELGERHETLWEVVIFGCLELCVGSLERAPCCSGL